MVSRYPHIPHGFTDRLGKAICILHGCSVPVILRPHNGVYQLVGESYVDGIMHGEVLMAGIKDSTIIIDPSRVEPLSMDNLLDQASQEDPDLNITEQEIEETPGQSLSSQCSQSSPAQAIPRAGSPTEDATRTEPLVEDTPMAGSTLEAKPRFRVTWKSVRLPNVYGIS